MAIRFQKLDDPVTPTELKAVLQKLLVRRNPRVPVGVMWNVLCRGDPNRVVHEINRLRDFPVFDAGECGFTYERVGDGNARPNNEPVSAGGNEPVATVGGGAAGGVAKAIRDVADGADSADSADSIQGDDQQPEGPVRQ